MTKRDNRSKPPESAIVQTTPTAPVEQLESLDGSDRQRFIDSAAIRFHLPGVPAAKAFRLADELWAAREVYLKERASKT